MLTQHEMVINELYNWKNTSEGSYEQTDDIAIVGIKL
tara:strand:- start:694 stop:804 length:111 start_codon:yes stop_codon:yes gene_type:complete